jgi:hypothetical protein
MRLDQLLKDMKAEEKPSIPPEFWLKPVELQREELKDMGLPTSMAIEWIDNNEVENATG